MEISKMFLLPARYANLSLIAEGGMGSVFAADDLILNRRVAVKILRRDSSHSERDEQLFMREVKALAALEHPNIVKILSWGNEPDRQAYYVMEFLAGETLSKFIGDGKTLRPVQFFEIFNQITNGLAYAHEQKIVHRDLKPSNIMLEAESETKRLVKIIDFGIARIENSSQEKTLTITGLNTGTPDYMSPEQCLGKESSHLSDIYSLGCIMYEALKGERPFQGESNYEQMYKHANEEAESLSAYATHTESRRLAKLIDRCLKKDPQARPQSAAEVNLELQVIFKYKLDTGKIFKSSIIEKRPGMPLLAPALAFLFLVPLLFAASMQLLFRKSSSELQPARHAEHIIRRSIKQMEAAVCRQEEKLNKLEDPEQRTNETVLLLDDYRRLAGAYRTNRQYESAERVLQKSLKYLPLVDKDEDNCRLRYLLEMSWVKAAANDRVGQMSYVNQGLACKSNDYASKAFLAQQRALYYLAEGELEKAEKDVEIIKTAGELYLREIHLDRVGGPPRMHHSFGLAVGVLNSLSASKFKNQSQKKAALRIYISLAGLFLDQGYYEKMDELTARADVLLGEIAEPGELKVKTKEILGKWKCIKAAQ